jgi:demethylmenaquinone methyltransferase / 2-methoxy-6-polyprenyl-1,4-benzoquinol methylase
MIYSDDLISIGLQGTGNKGQEARYKVQGTRDKVKTQCPKSNIQSFIVTEHTHIVHRTTYIPHRPSHILNPTSHIRNHFVLSSQPMSKYTHDTIVPFKDSELNKKKQVADMFNRIAFRYDFLNRFLSGGIDIYWRKKAIRELLAIDPKNILDVATGTGDVAILISKHLNAKKITGIDISEGMLGVGKQKITRLKLEDLVTLQTGDSEAIQFPDNSFDAITVAFGVRNFENLEKGLKEMLRVLKPGGRLVVLEFSKPKQGGVKWLYNMYMKLIAPGIGKLVSKNAEAYKYLNESVKAFPEGIDFLSILTKTGYTDTYSKTLSLCICTIYCGSK